MRPSAEFACILALSSLFLGVAGQNKGAKGEQVSAITNGPIKDLSMIFFIVSMLGSVTAVHFVLSRKLVYFPESVAIIAVGVVFGIILRFMGSAVQRFLEFEPPLFFYFVLPPIIFEAGYNLPKDIFMDNFVSILWYAIPGTVISAAVVSVAIFFLQVPLGYKYGLQESVAFGALISATDPVATLSVFQSLDVDRVLYMLVLGESVLNDAVAIVLYRTVTSHMSIVVAVVDFIYIFVGSTILGVITGIITALTFKHTRLRERTHVCLVMLLLGSYVAFLIGESLRMSGLIAVFFCGIVQDHYSSPNLPSVTRTVAHEVIHLIAFTCETSTFLYVGLTVGSMSYTLDARLVAVAFLACLLARAFNVFPLAFLTNLRRKVPVPLAHQVVMWFAGLRGGVAFGLSVQIPDAIPTKAVTVTMTVVIVLLTITLLGGGTLPLLQYQRGRSLGAAKRLQSKGDVIAMEYLPARTTPRGDVTVGSDMEGSCRDVIASLEEEELGRLVVSPSGQRRGKNLETRTCGLVATRDVTAMEPLSRDVTTATGKGWFNRLDVPLREWLCVDSQLLDRSDRLQSPASDD